MNERILIVEDETGLRDSLVDCLAARKYAVESTRDGRAGLDMVATSAFDMIILDIMLPSMSGLEVCTALRQRQIETPILMLTARSDLNDKVSGLRKGADDYMTKPFEMEELLARIEALLRRSALHGTERDQFHAQGVDIDFKNSRIVRNGRMTDLSEREARLLRYFVEHPGEVLTRQQLLRAVWGYNFAPLSRTVDVHVAWLRQKIEQDPSEPRLIRTVHRHGYRFDAEGMGALT